MIALSSKPLTTYPHDPLQPCTTVGTEPIRSGPSFALGLLVNRGVCLGDEFPDTAYSLRSAPASDSVCNLALGRCLPRREVNTRQNDTIQGHSRTQEKPHAYSMR